MGPVNLLTLVCVLVPLGFVSAQRTVCLQVTLKSTRSDTDSTIVRDRDGNPRSITFVKVWDQISKLKCVKNDNFFYANAFISAKNGCKATFKVCYEIPEPTTAAPLTTIAPGCEKISLLSRIKRPVAVTLNSEVLSLTLLKNINGKIPCEEGVNFGFDGNTVFSNSGCRGDFQVCTSDVSALTTTPLPTEEVCKEVTLRSTKKKPGRYTARDAGGNPTDITSVKVVRKISEVKCLEWITYFVNGPHLVAKKGCQARFEVCYRVEATTPGLLTTAAPVQCKRYRILRPTRLRLRDSNGNPTNINSVELRREISRRVCKRGTNFYFQDNLFVVNGGCKGIFVICYGVLTTAAPFTTEAPEVCKKVDVKRGRKEVRDADGNPVHITRVWVWDQISAIKCVEWVNYFYGDSFVEVKKGCRATFKVCYVPRPQTTAAPLTTPVTPEPGCELVELRSKKKKPAIVVYGDATIASMTLVRQISQIKCVRRRTYGFRGSRAFARRGCRGLFQICLDSAPLTTAPPVTCKTHQILKPTTKTVRDSSGQPADITGIVLQREISRDVCVEGVNYFFSGSQFTVRGGCKGVFQICYGNAPTTLAPLTTAPPVSCKKITIRGRRDITDASGNPVYIVHAHVWDQISATKCVEWVNYFVYDSYIVTNGGCHATFKVCYTLKTQTTAAPLTTESPVDCKTFAVLKPVTRTIRDSSNEPATIVSLTIKREISNAVCVRGTNYFFRNSRVVFRNGCKGIFEVCYLNDVAPLTTAAPNPNCKKVTIKSTATKPRRKDITDSNGNAVEIVRVKVTDQISTIKCKEWVNYFVFESHIVVRGGCKATFKVCYVPKTQTTLAPLTTTAPPVQCKKHKIVRPTRKIIRDSNGQQVEITRLTLKQEFSRDVCRRGVNFLYRGSVLVVRGGCKGLFRICYTSNEPTTAAPLTTVPSPICAKITVKSNGNGPKRRDITDANGNPVHIIHVYVWDQISATRCVEWVNYFYGDSHIIVKKGCQATFKVCYETKVVTTAAPLTTTPAPESCQKLKILTTTRKTITDSNGQPAEITQLKLVADFSKGKCRRGITYFYRGSELFVRGGCKGIFKLCYRDDALGLLTTPFPGECRTVTLRSTFKRPDKVRVTDDNGDPVEIAQVRVVTQLSKVECVERVNYYYRKAFLIAVKGCRATFEVCYSPITTAAPLTTPSPEICKKHKIKTPTRKRIIGSDGQLAPITSLELRVEFSRGVCVQGVNYLFSGSLLVVKGGCKGIFKICYRDDIEIDTTTAAPLTTPYPGICKSITLESKQFRPAKTKVTDDNGNPVQIAFVRVLKQLSKSPCKRGVSFFYKKSFLLVRKGCRATFEVCYELQTTTAAPLTTVNPAEEKCRFVTIKEPGQREIKDSFGRPAIITDLSIKRAFTAGCTLDTTYRIVDSAIEVDAGCEAVFKVCYTPESVAELTTASPEKCRFVTIKEPGQREIKDSFGRPATITDLSIKRAFTAGCTLDTTYRIVGSAIEVDAGCEAVFKVCYTPESIAELTTAAPEKCRKYTFKDPVVREFIVNKQATEIQSVTLVKNVESGDCQLNVNYSFDSALLTIESGCQGVFEICVTVIP